MYTLRIANNKPLMKRILLSVGIIGLGIATYKGLDYLVERDINNSIQNNLMPKSILVEIMPGKANKSIDLFLQNLDQIWQSTPRGEKTYVCDRVLDFTEDKSKKRLREVYGCILDFLQKKQFTNHMQHYLNQYENETGDNSLRIKYAAPEKNNINK